MLLDSVAASAVADKPVALAVVFIVALVIVALVIPFIDNRSGRLWVAVVVVIGAWILTNITPVEKWGVWIVWLRDNWWWMLVVVALFAVIALVSNRRK